MGVAGSRRPVVVNGVQPSGFATRESVLCFFGSFVSDLCAMQ